MPFLSLLNGISERDANRTRFSDDNATLTSEELFTSEFSIWETAILKNSSLSPKVFKSTPIVSIFRSGSSPCILEKSHICSEISRRPRIRVQYH